MKTSRLAIPALCLLAVVTPAAAEMQPSFFLDGIAWEGTHVVTAAPDPENRDAFRVIESWCGGLEPGTLLDLPDVVALRGEDGRIGPVSTWGADEGDPVTVSGDLAVLFLREGKDGWQAASKWGGAKVSVAFIEGDRIYGYIQVINPGPVELVALDITVEKMRKRVVEIAAGRAALDRIAAVEDPERRAAEASGKVGTVCWGATLKAYEILAGCGRAGVASLKKMIEEGSHPELDHRTIETLPKAGGISVGPYLTEFLRKDLAFWKTTGPRLERGWWNGKGIDRSEIEPLRRRYGSDHSALVALKEIRYPGCREVVVAFRDYWTSLPQLGGKGGITQIPETCNDLLALLPSSRSGHP